MEVRDDDTARLTNGSSDALRARRAAHRRSQQRRRRVGLGGAAAVVLVGGVVLANVGTDAIPPNVRVGGVDIGGLSPAEAKTRLAAAAKPLRKREIVLTSTTDPSFRRTVTGSAVTSAARIDDTVEAARTSRGRFGRLLAKVGVGSAKEFPLRFAVTDEAVTGLIRETQDTLSAPAVSATVKVVDGEITTTPAKPGKAIDRAKLVAQIERLPETIALPIRDAAPEADDADARQAKTLAERILATERLVTYGDRSTPLTAKVTRAALRFPVRKRTIAVDLDADTIRTAVVKPLGIAEGDPKDARLQIRGERVVVIQSLPGIQLDAAALATAIAKNPDAPTVPVTVTKKRATFRTADARALKVTERISSFTTPYACCPPRVTNIRRAVQTLNGTIIPAGARFSLNDNLGQRTAARGYVKAPTIAAGELVDSYGGGVSQVATTTYNAAFFAGLEIIANTPHEFWISRYPKGREATLSWGGPDVVFRNDWDAAILVAAFAGNNGVTVSFYSSKLGRRIESGSGEPTNPTKPKTIERKDPSLPPGTRNIKQSAGSGGFAISYTRKVYVDDTVRRNETFRWTYRPENAIVVLGPPKPEEPDTPDKPDTPETPTTPSTPSTPATPATPPTPPTSTTPVDPSPPAP